MECLHRTKEVSPASEIKYPQSLKADHIFLNRHFAASKYTVSRPSYPQRSYNVATLHRSPDTSPLYISLVRSQGQKRSRPISSRNRHTKVKTLEKQQRGEQPEPSLVSD